MDQVHRLLNQIFHLDLFQDDDDFTSKYVILAILLSYNQRLLEQLVSAARCSTFINVNMSYNHFQNILRFFDVLLNFPFTTSETMDDCYL